MCLNIRVSCSKTKWVLCLTAMSHGKFQVTYVVWLVLYGVFLWVQSWTAHRVVYNTMWCLRTFRKKKPDWKVTVDLLYMEFTYHTKGNQRGCSRCSNGFSLGCLGPWMNHLPHVWWSTFRFTFLIVSQAGFLYWFLAFIHISYISKFCLWFVLSNWFTLK